MLEKLTIKNFKALVDFKIDLAPMTVLIGANGAGKSSVLQAVEMLTALTREDIHTFLNRKEWDYGDLLNRHDQTVLLSWKAYVRLHSLKNQPLVRWTMELHKKKGPYVAAERVSVLDGNEWRRLLDRDGRTTRRYDRYDKLETLERISLPKSFLSTLDTEDEDEEGENRDRFPEMVALLDWAKRTHSYDFRNPRVLRLSSRKTTELGEEGWGVPSVVDSLSDERRAVVEARLRRIFPRIRKLVTKRGPFGTTRLLVSERTGNSSVEFGANQVSDGLLRFLAADLVGEQAERPSCALIEEPENGIHPRLASAVMRTFRDLSRGKKPIQVIATTHSPILLNFLDPSEVRIVSRKSGGAPRATPLEQTSAFKISPSGFMPGELWYNLGEK